MRTFGPHKEMNTHRHTHIYIHTQPRRKDESVKNPDCILALKCLLFLFQQTNRVIWNRLLNIYGARVMHSALQAFFLLLARTRHITPILHLSSSSSNAEVNTNSKAGLWISNLIVKALRNRKLWHSVDIIQSFARRPHFICKRNSSRIHVRLEGGKKNQSSPSHLFHLFQLGAASWGHQRLRTLSSFLFSRRYSPAGSATLWLCTSFLMSLIRKVTIASCGLRS